MADHGQAKWTRADKCLWDGPPAMLCKHSLRDIFTQAFGASQASEVTPFFQHTLKIQDAGSEDIVDELTEIRDRGLAGFDGITMLYRRLAAECVTTRRRKIL